MNMPIGRQNTMHLWAQRIRNANPINSNSNGRTQNSVWANLSLHRFRAGGASQHSASTTIHPKTERFASHKFVFDVIHEILILRALSLRQCLDHVVSTSCPMCSAACTTRTKLIITKYVPANDENILFGLEKVLWCVVHAIHNVWVECLMKMVRRAKCVTPRMQNRLLQHSRRADCGELIDERNNVNLLFKRNNHVPLFTGLKNNNAMWMLCVFVSCSRWVHRIEVHHCRRTNRCHVQIKYTADSVQDWRGWLRGVWARADGNSMANEVSRLAAAVQRRIANATHFVAVAHFYPIVNSSEISNASLSMEWQWIQSNAKVVVFDLVSPNWRTKRVICIDSAVERVCTNKTGHRRTANPLQCVCVCATRWTKTCIVASPALLCGKISLRTQIICRLFRRACSNLSTKLFWVNTLSGEWSSDNNTFRASHESELKCSPAVFCQSHACTPLSLVSSKF